jgi:MGT family glycosyltransferase
MIRAFRERFLPPSRRATLVLHATDREFDPAPPTMPANHHQVGPLIWESGDSPDMAFLDEPGPRWVLVTLSTLPQSEEILLARAAIEALAGRPVRALVTLPPGQPVDQLGELPPNARLTGFVPHRAVLSRASLAISQAGHGLVMKCLSHGVPMVLIPWDRDQPGVAARAQALGVADVIVRSECTSARVARAIERVLGESSYPERAAVHARRLEQEDPVGSACRLILERC